MPEPSAPRSPRKPRRDTEVPSLPVAFSGTEALPDLVDRCLRAAVDPLLGFISSNPHITHPHAGTWPDSVAQGFFRWDRNRDPSRDVRDHERDPYVLTRWLRDTWGCDGGWTVLTARGITSQDVEQLFQLRNGHAHNQYVADPPLGASQVQDGLGTLHRILNAIGAPAQEAYVLRAYEIAREKAERLTKRKQWLGLSSDEPAGRPHTVGLHWTEPEPETLKPQAWWLVHLDGRGELQGSVVPRSTEDVLKYLDRFQDADTPVLMGCAFCLSVPVWLAEHCAVLERLPAPEAMWRVAEEHAEPAYDASSLIANVNSALGLEDGPFWRGDANEPDPNSAADRPDMRATELSVKKQTEAQPSSVFRVGGDASVGALALWGMPVLPWLRESGFRIWPFEEPGRRTVVEIFPRSLWAATQPEHPVRSRPADREQFLSGRAAVGLGGGTQETFLTERRAFDALLTAWALRRYGGNLARTPRGSRPEAVVEGEIWLPTPSSKRPG